jgi:hypothetical protein
MRYDIDLETMNRIAEFESYVEGNITIKDFGRIFVVIVESNACDSINVYVKGNDYYTFTCVSNGVQENETGPFNGNNLSDFINCIMKDIAGDP